MRRSVLFLGIVLATLPGCFPYVMSYVYLDGPGVTYRRAPRDVAITIPHPIARVVFHGDKPGKAMEVELKAAPLDWQGPYVDEMRRRSPLAEHRFVFVGLPPVDSPGTLEMPVVYANGVALESPLLTFERRTYAGMPPLNC